MSKWLRVGEKPAAVQNVMFRVTLESNPILAEWLWKLPYGTKANVLIEVLDAHARNLLEQQNTQGGPANSEHMAASEKRPPKRSAEVAKAASKVIKTTRDHYAASSQPVKSADPCIEPEPLAQQSPHPTNTAVAVEPEAGLDLLDPASKPVELAIQNDSSDATTPIRSEPIIAQAHEVAAKEPPPVGDVERKGPMFDVEAVEQMRLLMSQID